MIKEMDSLDRNDVLPSYEVEIFIETLQLFELKEIGSPKWNNQHERLSKLNMQSIMEATSNIEEAVKNLLVSNNKVTVLIHELICIGVYKEKILPLIVEAKFNPRSTIPIFSVLYQEAILVNIFATIFYHEDAIESAQDYMIDFIDYVSHKLIQHVHEFESPEDKQSSGGDDPNDFYKYENNLVSEISKKLIAVMSGIVQHISKLGVSGLHRLLQIHDIPMLLIKILTTPELLRSMTEEESSADQMALNKTNGQIWLCLLRILTDPECQQKYEFNDYRKNQILKLKGLINDVLLDQIPILSHLQKLIEHMILSKPPPIKPNLIIEQMSEIRNSILHQCKGKWKEIAKLHMEEYLNPSEECIKQQALRLVDSYNLDHLADYLDDKPKCPICGKVASKKCSRCKQEWYCGRECQVKHWTKHQKACDLMKT